MPLFFSFALAAQPDAPRPAFEVVDIKVDKSGAIAPQKERFLPGGRLEMNSATLKELVAAIYGVKPGLLIGGPDWFDSVRFNILAKANPDTPVPVLLEMAKTMFGDQFQLKFHREDRVLPGYALVVAKDGPKFKPSEGGGRQSCRSKPVPVPAEGIPVIHRECRNITIPEFVRQLGMGGYGIDDRPLIDLTKLTGAYDIDFDYSRPRPAGATGDGRGLAELTGPTIFEAMAKVGLKLESGKYPVPAMVIDHAERPPDN